MNQRRDDRETPELPGGARARTNDPAPRLDPYPAPLFESAGRFLDERIQTVLSQAEGVSETIVGALGGIEGSRLAPARGAFYGLTGGSTIWIGLWISVRSLFA